MPATQDSSDIALLENALLKKADAELPPMTEMTELGEYIKIKGKKLLIAVSHELTGSGRMRVRLSRGNVDGTDDVYHMFILSLSKGITVFEVMGGKKKDVPVFSKYIDTEKLHNKTKDLDAILKIIWDTFYPLPKVNLLAEEANAKLEEQENSSLPSRTKMVELGKYITTYLMGQASIKINGKMSFIVVSCELKDRGQLFVRLSRRNPNRTELVHRLAICSLTRGVTIFEVLPGEEGHVTVYSKSIDTEKVHNKTEDLDEMLKHIWETYYPRPQVAATSSNVRPEVNSSENPTSSHSIPSVKKDEED
jgi:hypothetical protein